MTSSSQAASAMLAGQSAASALSFDESVRAAEEAIDGYGRAKTAGKTDQDAADHRKKKDVLSENRQLREENQKLRAENNLLKAGKDYFMKRTQELKLKLKELRLKLKRQVCLLDEISYIYMFVMKCLISLWLPRIVYIYN